MDKKTVEYRAVRRSSVYRSAVETAAQPPGYPTALRCIVTQNILVPFQEDLQACQILGPSTARIELKFSLQIGKEVIKAESFIDSSLCTEIISELTRAVDQDTNSFKAIGPAQLIAENPTVFCVALELWPLEGPLKRTMDNYRPTAIVESLDLELKYALDRQKNRPFQRSDSPVPKINFDSLIHVQPLVLPLKLSLQEVITRFLNRNLLKQLPLVFNSLWQKYLRESLPKQDLISHILTRFALQSVSDELRFELGLDQV